MSYSKTVSFTPQRDIADAIYDHCRSQSRLPNGERYDLLLKNPQNLVREALHAEGIISKKQDGCGDRSTWKPGQSIKVSLWNENASALTDYSEEQGTTKQKVMAQVVMNYLHEQQVTS